MKIIFALFAVVLAVGGGWALYSISEVDDYKVVESFYEKACVEMMEGFVKSPETFKVLDSDILSSSLSREDAEKLNQEYYGDVESAFNLGREHISERYEQPRNPLKTTFIKVRFSSANSYGTPMRNDGLCEFIQSPAFRRPVLSYFEVDGEGFSKGSTEFTTLTMLKVDSETLDMVESSTEGFETEYPSGNLKATFGQKAGYWFNNMLQGS